MKSMAFEMTSLACRESPETQASARVARCQVSWWSTSATEISNRRRSLSFSPLRMWRLPLSEPTSGRWISTVPTAMRADDMAASRSRATDSAARRRRGQGHGRARLPPASERPRDLLRGEGLDDVSGLHTADALDAYAALESLQHFAHVVLEAPKGGDRALAKHRVAALDAHAGAANHLAFGDH